jgi:hypothetical protein
VTLEEATACWAAEINAWYGINATVEEVLSAFNNNYRDKKAYDGTSYVDMFFRKKCGSYTKCLDTADREGLADCIEVNREFGENDYS